MLEICFLGTGAMMPLPDRRLAALLVRLNGRLLLIDCGEGTQVAVRESGWSLARIDAICITHFHADHIAGLPGLLLTMGSSGRTQPVRVIGPKGLELVVRCLRVIAPELPYELRFEELTGRECEIGLVGGARVRCAALEHVIQCYGYAVELDRPGRFDRARAEAQCIPIDCWGALQAGESVVAGGRTYTPEMVLGPARRGIKLVYCTDTKPSESIVGLAKDADLFICEGTFADDDKAEKAARYGHMTFAGAAELAKRAQARELLLTHFSPSIADPEACVGAARSVFANADVAHDNLHRALRFED